LNQRTIRMIAIAAVLIVSFIAISGFLKPSCYPFYVEKDAEVSELSAKEAFSMINRNKDNSDFIILDIRTLEEYESGHLENSIRIDYYSSDFEEQLDKLDKNKTYLIYCRSGNRSSKALNIMQELGFKEAYHISGGINEWTEEGFPIVVD